MITIMNKLIVVLHDVLVWKEPKDHITDYYLLLLPHVHKNIILTLKFVNRRMISDENPR